MGRSCCAKPAVRIIEVAKFEAGIVGLEQAFWNVVRMGIEDDSRLREELLSAIRALDNYVSRSGESHYKEALLKKFRIFHAAPHRTQFPPRREAVLNSKRSDVKVCYGHLA